MNESIALYHDALEPGDRELCQVLAEVIDRVLPEAENKVWHRHPVWFLDGNPVVGYSKQKAGIRLMFWSGQDFGEEGLKVRGGKFKDASVFYQEAGEVNTEDLERWCLKARTIQWDYKHIVKNKGLLKKL